MERGQTSVEFLLLLAILLVAFVIMVMQTTGKDSLSFAYRQKLSAEDIAYSAAFNINQIANSGHGSNTTILLPTFMDDSTPYNITIHKNVLSLNYHSRTVQTTLVTSSINATNLTANRSYSLRNNQGMIEIG